MRKRSRSSRWCWQGRRTRGSSRCCSDKAVGLSGKDGDLIVAQRMRPKGVDIGYVGEITAVHPELLEILAREGYIPVISSVAVGPDGETLNINADHVAGRIAGELKAEKLLLLTDVAGILADKDDPASLI